MKNKSLLKTMCLLVSITLLLTSCNKDSKTTNAAVDGDLTLKDNQTLVIGQITAINGNEITLALATEMTRPSNNSSNESVDSKTDSQGDSQSDSQRPNRGNVSSADSDNQAPSGGMPSDNQSSSSDNQAPSGGMPSDDQSSSSDNQPPSGGMPSDGQTSSSDNQVPSGGMPSDDQTTDSATSSNNSSKKSNSNNSSDSSDSQKQSKVMYTLTGEEQTMLIPVGTPVTTLLGTISTFSRIAVDNTVKIVTQKNDAGEDVIVAVYIVG